MTHSAANVIVLEPAPARHIAPSPDAGGQVLPLRKRKKSNMRYAGTISAGNRFGRSRRKYGEFERVYMDGHMIRRLNKLELAEWHERLGKIMDAKSQIRRQPLGCEEVV